MRAEAGTRELTADAAIAVDGPSLFLEGSLAALGIVALLLIAERSLEPGGPTIPNVDLSHADLSRGGELFRNTTCTILGFGSSGYGLAASTLASSSRLKTTTDDQIPNLSSMADSSAVASFAVLSSAVLNSTLPLWM